MPRGISLDKAEQIIVEKFRALRRDAYHILPSDCLLKPRNVLTSDMVQMLDSSMITGGLIDKEDICSICCESGCPHNNIPDRPERIAGVGILIVTEDCNFD